MKSKILPLLLMTCFASCQTYKSSFDCPPCKGVPCASVSDIQKMIIETPDGGPDLFTRVIPSEIEQCNESRSWKKGVPSCLRKRIWVAEVHKKNTIIQGHFIYFNEPCCEEVFQ